MKKFLFMAFMVCLPVLAFAEKKTQTPEKEPVPVSAEMEKYVLKKVTEKSNFLLNNIQESLMSMDSKKYPQAYDKAKKITKKMQKTFVYSTDSTKLSELFDDNKLPKNNRFNSVLEKLNNRDKYQNTFYFENIIVGTPKFVEKKSKKSFIFEVPVTFDDRSIVKMKDTTSVVDVKYRTELVWTIEVKEVVEKVTDENGQKVDKISYEAKDAKVELISCEPSQLTYLPSEQSEMRIVAMNAIKDWYENLPDKLDAARVEQEADVDSVCVRNMEVPEVQGSMDYTERTYTWKPAEKVTVDINPKKYVAGKEHLYDLDNLSASVTFTPEFTVVLSAEPYKVASFNVDYTNYDVKEPSTKEEKAKRDSLATEFIGNYITSLETYAAGDKTTRETLRPSLEAMFADGAIVEVSYFPRGGGDRKIERKVGKYLTLLKDAELTVEDLKRGEIGENVESITYSFTQLFKGKKGKKYSDEVDKVVKMEYQDDRWVITGITIDGNTRH